MSMSEPDDRRGDAAGRRMSDTVSRDEIHRLIAVPVQRADEDRREWRARLEALRTDVQALTRSVDGVGGKLDGVSQRLERLTTKLDHHAQSIADHETRMSVAETRLDPLIGLPVRVSELQKALESLERTVATLVAGAKWAVYLVLAVVLGAVLRLVVTS